MTIIDPPRPIRSMIDLYRAFLHTVIHCHHTVIHTVIHMTILEPVMLSTLKLFKKELVFANSCQSNFVHMNSW